MSNLQLIEELCGLVEKQAVIIRRLASTLEQANSLSDAERQGVEDAEAAYRKILGADEFPDVL